MCLLKQIKQLFTRLMKRFAFTFMHLADTFIQSDLQCIEAIHALGV